MPADLPFSVTAFPVTFKGRTILFVRPANPDQVLDTISEESYADDKFLPYWAEHWPSADVFLSFLESVRMPPQTLVCELGAGLGVISSLVAAQGLLCVSTDLSPVSCRYARANHRRAAAAPAVVGCDWRMPPFKRQFDMILGSDILYEERWITPIALFLKQFLAPCGTAYIADPCRTHWEGFKERCMREGMRVATAHSGLAQNGKTRVEVVAITRHGR